MKSNRFFREHDCASDIVNGDSIRYTVDLARIENRSTGIPNRAVLLILNAHMN